MLKVIVNTINVITAGYVIYLVGATVYEMGKESGKREAAGRIVDSIVGDADEHGNPAFRYIDGCLYKRVDK